MKKRSPKEMARLDRAFIRAHRQDAVIEQNGFCCYCQEPITVRSATADHVQARARGGSNSRDNLVAACQPCNKTKGAMSEKAFRAAIEAPQPHHNIYLHLAASRLRIWRAAHASCGRIMGCVDQPYRGPKKRK